ncbi:alanine aminotransferase 1 isoform X1 [Acyrthosiphon pisum]|uniref:alanine transaminase n=2 Tax=Acyrthosiphon pisum TaxID=7029 RepID=A0A8R2A1Q7_ACYPI|nr:alanine aminotransferase 1 isoform X1 [Acyrthosiphon pisum]|eukprot:XP_001948711.2 PREDICTED: alanine aminotransferase 1 isoform X1 [Acyrthosiphon pisum]
MSLQRLNKFVRCSANYNVCRYVKSQLEFSQFLRLSVNSKNFSTGQNMSSNQKVLNLDNMNPNVRIMEYAVRGPLLIRATEIENELKKGIEKPFKEVLKANIGDCHAMGQKPITFIRQVLALVSQPELLEDDRYPEDVKERARTILDGCRGGSVGSYTDSPGIEIIRKHVARYIERRDGIPCDYLNVLLCAGASDGIKAILRLLVADVDGKKPGVLIPIPQYPLYSATLAEFNVKQVGYFLDENKNWGLDVNELERSITEARKHCNPRAIVVINPGNPTGQVLTKENVVDVIKFAYKEKLFLLADEVYQDNVYAEGSTFYSFKKVLTELGSPYSEMELASFMSCSKGYMGECGLRGGYTEVINLDPEVKAMLLKSVSAMLCPTVLGQTVMDCVVNPPQPGEPSYESFQKEKNCVLKSLAERAKLVADTFNSIPGMSCNPVQGAMYAFPLFKLPEKAIKEAKNQGIEPNAFYAFQLLENTGICIVPGSGFGQVEGTYHFRTTILPQPDKLKNMLDNFKDFHLKFLEQWK